MPALYLWRRQLLALRAVHGSPHSLSADFDVLLESVEKLLRQAEREVGKTGTGGAGGEEGGGGGDDGARRRAAAPSVAGADAVEGEGCNGGGGSGGGGGDGGGGGGDGGGDGARRRAAAPSAGASVAEARVTFEELRIALLRALARVKHYHSHERRAAHEAKVLERLMKEAAYHARRHRTRP